MKPYVASYSQLRWSWRVVILKIVAWLLWLPQGLLACYPVVLTCYFLPCAYALKVNGLLPVRTADWRLKEPFAIFHAETILYATI